MNLVPTEIPNLSQITNSYHLKLIARRSLFSLPVRKESEERERERELDNQEGLKLSQGTTSLRIPTCLEVRKFLKDPLLLAGENGQNG